MSRKCIFQIVIFATMVNTILNQNACPVGRYTKYCSCTHVSLTDYEIGCPDSTEDIRMTVMLKQNVIDIQCTLHGASWNTTQFPSLQNVSKIKKIIFKYCPKPQNNFSELLLEHFHIDQPKMLLFHSTEENNMVNFKKEMFVNLDGLDKLDLTKNKIETIDDDLFEYLINLKCLLLNENSIVTFHPETFKYTTKLQELELNNNKIERLEKTTFRPLKELKELLLFDNRLNEIDKDLFSENIKLERLDLTFNPIRNMDANLFRNNVNLKVIRLRQMELRELPEDLFKNNRALELISLDSNDRISLPDRLITNMTNLRNVGMSNCGLKNIAEDFFVGLKQLKTLDLSINLISAISDDLFKDLSNLEVLLLNTNLIEKINNNMLMHLNKLQVIDFSNNLLHTISDQAFFNMELLTKAIFFNNSLTFEDSDFITPFYNCRKLKEINISYNNITKFDEGVFLQYPTLEILNLQNNKITKLDFYNLISSPNVAEVYLQNNEIVNINAKHYGVFHNNLADSRDHKLFLSNNPIRCDCEIYDFVNYVQDIKITSWRIMEDITCDGPFDYQHVSLKSLDSRELTCPMEVCPEECVCRRRPYDKNYLVDCSYKNMTRVPVISINDQTLERIEVNLNGNLLEDSPSMLEGYKNVTRLYLSGNNIKQLKWIPPKIEVLHVNDNELELINYETLRQLNDSNIHDLSLSNNPWMCDCTATNFTTYLRANSAKQRINVNNITCHSSGRKLVDLNAENLCKNLSRLFMIWVIILLLVLVILVAMIAIYYRYKLELKIWLFAHNMFLTFVSEKEIDKDKIYDAFVSFAHQDEDYVINELLSELEEQTDSPYKLCIHFRDWLGGELIMTQIVKSIEESRRTIVVLSEHFLESVWGKIEFRMAHQKALAEQCARVIVIIYGDVNPDEIIDEELKAYLKTHTYIRADDKWFWYKLKYALPHSNNAKIRKTKSDHLRKVFKKIDKLDLVPTTFNSTANIVVDTPTEITLDPLLLKNSQIAFDNTLTNNNNKNNSNTGNTTPIEENNRKV